MPKMPWLRHRLSIWKDIVYSPAKTVIAGVYAFAQAVSWARNEIFHDSENRWRFMTLIPDWPWWGWVLGWLLLALGITLEGSYRVVARLRRTFKIEVDETYGDTDDTGLSRLLLFVNVKHPDGPPSIVDDWRIHIRTADGTTVESEPIFLSARIRMPLTPDRRAFVEIRPESAVPPGPISAGDAVHGWLWFWFRGVTWNELIAPDTVRTISFTDIASERHSTSFDISNEESANKARRRTLGPDAVL